MKYLTQVSMTKTTAICLGLVPLRPPPPTSGLLSCSLDLQERNFRGK